MRPHVHPPDRLHGWVFQQHQVWVDCYGNEHEIESMSGDYVANVIRFCLERADRAYGLASLDGLIDVLALAVVGEWEAACDAVRSRSVPDKDPGAWLEETPLMRALRRRLIDTGTSL